MELNSDGTMVGMSFTKQDIGRDIYVTPPDDRETYRAYKARVDKAVEEGFHLGDLSFSEWQTYCIGGGQTGEDVDIDMPIGYQDPEREERGKAAKEAEEKRQREEEEYEERCRQRDAEWEEEHGY